MIDKPLRDSRLRKDLAGECLRLARLAAEIQHLRPNGTCQGIANLQRHHSDVPIHLAAVDDHLNEIGYIVPGLGDAGDRQFGTA